MREIKFRAWDKLNKMLVQVQDLDLIQLVDGEYFISAGLEDVGEYLRLSKEIVLMQYTGLKDKHSKEIYEGDILARRAGYNNPEIIRKGTVEFVNGKYENCLYYPHKQRRYLFDSASIYEVIGNIYENPELLEAKDKANASL